MEFDVSQMLDIPNILSIVIAGIVIEALRRFGERLSGLERADHRFEERLTDIEVDMAKSYVTRDEITAGNRDLRSDMKAYHEVQMRRLDDIHAKVDHRIDRVADLLESKADK